MKCIFHPEARVMMKKGNWPDMKPLIKYNHFSLVKIVHIFPEDRRNRATITTHFVKDTITIPAPESNQLN